MSSFISSGNKLNHFSMSSGTTLNCVNIKPNCWAHYITRKILGIRFSNDVMSIFPRKVITKTRLYNSDPLEPHFYIVKLGFTGVYIIFLISAQNIDCGYSLEPSRWGGSNEYPQSMFWDRGGSNEYPQSMFWAEIWKNIRFFLWKFTFSGGKIFSTFEWACFRNVNLSSYLYDFKLII